MNKMMKRKKPKIVFDIFIIHRREECPSEVQRHNHHGAE